MLIVLFVSPFEGVVSQRLECAVAPKVRKIFDILFENNLLLRIYKYTKFGKKARAFSQSVAALTVTHPGA